MYVMHEIGFPPKIPAVFLTKNHLIVRITLHVIEISVITYKHLRIYLLLQR